MGPRLRGDDTGNVVSRARERLVTAMPNRQPSTARAWHRRPIGCMATSWHWTGPSAAPPSVVARSTMMGRAVSDDNAEQPDQLRFREGRTL